MRILAVCVIAWMGVGCGIDMERHYQGMRQKLIAHDYDGALGYLDAAKEDLYGEKNRLLYFMNKGMVLHLAGKYAESNACLEKAKQAADALWTESVSSNAAAWLTTDNTLPYQGEDFEKVLIHSVAALNYLALHNDAAAQVEARQVSQKLDLYNAKYGEVKNAYRDDAFCRWLSGKLTEVGRTEAVSTALNEAWIDYKKSLVLYEKDYGSRYGTRVPQFVVADAKRVLAAIRKEFPEDWDAVHKRYPNVTFVAEEEAQKQGEIIVIHLNGEAPYKQDKYWTAVAGPNVIRIAYPEFVPKFHQIQVARVSLEAGPAVASVTQSGASELVQAAPLAANRTLRHAQLQAAVATTRPQASQRSQYTMRTGAHQPMQPMQSWTTTTEVAEDVAAIAVQNLQDHMARIKTKAIARQVSKFVAAKSMQVGGVALANKGKNERDERAVAGGAALQIAGLLTEFASAIMEEADKRSWITLPATVTVGRLYVPPGDVTLHVDFLDKQGGVVETTNLATHVDAGKTVFLMTRTYR